MRSVTIILDGLPVLSVLKLAKEHSEDVIRKTIEEADFPLKDF